MALVLSRKVEQSIIIADTIRITVLQIKGSVVRIAVDAPSEVRILRGELRPRGQAPATKPAQMK